MANPIKFREVLKTDQNCLDYRMDRFEEIGILELFDRMLELFSDFTSEVERHTATLSFGKKDPTTKKVDWNDRLRLHMLGSAVAQFIFAFSHVCRRQTPEAYIHMRRAIEAAGIAYTSRLKPEIGELYGKSDEQAFWKHIKRDRILPNHDPMTSELNKMMKRAASQLHGNLQSIAGSVEEDFEFHGSRVEISFEFAINDRNADIEYVWEVCSFILHAMYRVALLFSESFKLPKGLWHDDLEIHKASIDEFDAIVKDQSSVPRS